MLTPEIADDVVAQCQVAAGEIGQAFTRAFDSPIEAAIGEPTSLRLLDSSDGLESPGVIVTLHFGLTAMAVLVPQASGLLPPAYDSADPRAQSKLTSLAQELGMLVLPEALLAEDAQAFCVSHLAEALREGGAAESATVIPMLLKSAGKQEEALIIWPLSNARNIKRAIDARGADASPSPHDQASTTSADIESTDVGETITDVQSGSPAAKNAAAVDHDDVSTVEQPASASASVHVDSPQTGGSSRSKPKGTARGPSLRDLPPYSRSLLKIRVPLSVTLAEKKQPLGQILEIGPGSILQFEKSCEEMLDLNVSNLPIARGEAVKVGDKFGLRVTSLILPSERFKAVQPALPGFPPATV